MAGIVQFDGLEGARSLALDAALIVGKAAILLHHRHAHFVHIRIEIPDRPRRAHAQTIAAEIAAPSMKVQLGRTGAQHAISHLGHPDNARMAHAATTVALHARRQKAQLVLRSRRAQKIGFRRAVKGFCHPAESRERRSGTAEPHERATRVLDHGFLRSPLMPLCRPARSPDPPMRGILR